MPTASGSRSSLYERVVGSLSVHSRIFERETPSQGRASFFGQHRGTNPELAEGGAERLREVGVEAVVDEDLPSLRQGAIRSLCNSGTFRVSDSDF